MDKNLILVSGAVVFKESRGRVCWFLIKQLDGSEWEFPKVVVRKGESSVRAVIRMMGEKGGMSTRVLEEVGRAGGIATVNHKTLPQRHLYYLMLLRSSAGEVVGFPYYEWLEYRKALKKISSRREKVVLKHAKDIYKKWAKLKKRKKPDANQDNFEEIYEA